MSVTDKGKVTINLSGKSNTELAAYLGISNQSLSIGLSQWEFFRKDLTK